MFVFPDVDISIILPYLLAIKHVDCTIWKRVVCDIETPRSASRSGVDFPCVCSIVLDIS